MPREAPPPQWIPDGIGFWFVAWLGTTTAGGLFGLWCDGIIGLISGLILAGITAFFLQGCAAILTWFLWLFRFQVTMAAIAGSATGILSTASVFMHLTLFREANIPLVLALVGLLGALGGGLSGFWYKERLAACGFSLDTMGGCYPKHMTRDDVLTRIVVFVMVTAFISLLFLRP